jgi:hypothetical protein
MYDSDRNAPPRRTTGASRWTSDTFEYADADTALR